MCDGANLQHSFCFYQSSSKRFFSNNPVLQDRLQGFLCTLHQPLPHATEVGCTWRLKLPFSLLWCFRHLKSSLLAPYKVSSIMAVYSLWSPTPLNEPLQSHNLFFIFYFILTNNRLTASKKVRKERKKTTKKKTNKKKIFSLGKRAQ